MTLRIPFVLWTSAPSHHITAINDSRYPSWLLTGASNGITCMWKSKQLKFKQSVVVPEFIMIPSTCSPVLSIACVSLDEHIYAICVYDNSDIGVWNLEDGSLFAIFPFPRGKPISVVAVDYDLIAIIGHFNSIYIFNPFELKIVRELKGHEKWVRSVCVGRVEKIPFLISYGLDSQILSFSLDRMKLYSENALRPTYYLIPPDHPGLLRTQYMLNRQQKIYKKHMKQQNVKTAHSSESVHNRYNSLSNLLVSTRSLPTLPKSVQSTLPNLPKLGVYFVAQSAWGFTDGKLPGSAGSKTTNNNSHELASSEITEDDLEGGEGRQMTTDEDVENEDFQKSTTPDEVTQSAGSNDQKISDYKQGKRVSSIEDSAYLPLSTIDGRIYSSPYMEGGSLPLLLLCVQKNYAMLIEAKGLNVLLSIPSPDEEDTLNAFECSEWGFKTYNELDEVQSLPITDSVCFLNETHYASSSSSKKIFTFNDSNFKERGKKNIPNENVAADRVVKQYWAGGMFVSQTLFILYTFHPIFYVFKLKVENNEENKEKNDSSLTISITLVSCTHFQLQPRQFLMPTLSEFSSYELLHFPPINISRKGNIFYGSDDGILFIASLMTTNPDRQSNIYFSHKIPTSFYSSFGFLPSPQHRISNSILSFSHITPSLLLHRASVDSTVSVSPFPLFLNDATTHLANETIKTIRALDNATTTLDDHNMFDSVQDVVSLASPTSLFDSNVVPIAHTIFGGRGMDEYFEDFEDPEELRQPPSLSSPLDKRKDHNGPSPVPSPLGVESPGLSMSLVEAGVSSSPSFASKKSGSVANDSASPNRILLPQTSVIPINKLPFKHNVLLHHPTSVDFFTNQLSSTSDPNILDTFHSPITAMHILRRFPHILLTGGGFFYKRNRKCPPSSTTFESCSLEGACVCVWNFLTGKLIHAFKEHNAPIAFFSEPPKEEGEIIYDDHYFEKVSRYQIRTSREVSNMKRKWNSYFASVSIDGTVCLMRIDLMQCVFVFSPRNGPVNSLHWHSQTHTLLIVMEEKIAEQELAVSELMMKREFEQSEKTLSFHSFKNNLENYLSKSHLFGPRHTPAMVAPTVPAMDGSSPIIYIMGTGTRHPFSSGFFLSSSTCGFVNGSSNSEIIAPFVLWKDWKKKTITKSTKDSRSSPPPEPAGGDVGMNVPKVFSNVSSSVQTPDSYSQTVTTSSAFGSVTTGTTGVNKGPGEPVITQPSFFAAKPPLSHPKVLFEASLKHSLYPIVPHTAPYTFGGHGFIYDLHTGSLIRHGELPGLLASFVALDVGVTVREDYDVIEEALNCTQKGTYTKILDKQKENDSERRKEEAMIEVILSDNMTAPTSSSSSSSSSSSGSKLSNQHPRRLSNSENTNVSPHSESPPPSPTPSPLLVDSLYITTLLSRGFELYYDKVYSDQTGVGSDDNFVSSLVLSQKSKDIFGASSSVREKLKKGIIVRRNQPNKNTNQFINADSVLSIMHISLPSSDPNDRVIIPYVLLDVGKYCEAVRKYCQHSIHTERKSKSTIIDNSANLAGKTPQFFLFPDSVADLVPGEIQSKLLLSLLPLFLPWGITPENDKYIKDFLSLPGPPLPGVSFLIGNQTPQSITLSLPSSSFGVNSLCLTHTLSSALSVASMSMLNSVMVTTGMIASEVREWTNFIEKQFLYYCDLIKSLPPAVIASEVVEPYVSMARKYMAPSLPLIASLSHNTSKFIRVSFVYLLHNLISSANLKQRERIAMVCRNLLPHIGKTPNSDDLLFAHILTRIGLIDGKQVTRYTQPLLNLLLHLISVCASDSTSLISFYNQHDSPDSVSAYFNVIDLLLDGLNIFVPHIPDVPSLFKQLFSISLLQQLVQYQAAAPSSSLMMNRTPENTSMSGGGGAVVDPAILSMEKEIIRLEKNARRAILALGMLDMKMMMISLVQQLEHPANEFDHHVRCKNALLVLQQWIGALRIKPSHVHLLSYTLQLICRFESPNYPTVRLDLQKEAIELIQWMLKYFPMCAFHQGTTRFAIGLASGVVEVWNVSEAEREKSFEGHRGAVSALSFRSDGKILVTFSEVEGNVKTWTLGVFSSIKSFLGFSSSKNKKHGVKKLKTTPANNMEYFARARISWKNDTNVILIRFENKDEGYDPINDGKKADKVRDLKNFEDKAETKVLLKQFMKDNDIIVDDILMSDK